MHDQTVLDRRVFLRSSVALTAGGVLVATARAAPSPPDVGGEVQLLLDDWIVAEKQGLRRVLHRPRKRGLIQEADGRDWERGSIYHGNIACRDRGGRFHMTYRYYWWDPSVRTLHPSIAEDRAHWFRELTGYATSTDGVRWHRPKLGLADAPAGFRKVAEFPFEVPTRMSKENNLGCPIDFIYDLHAHGNVTESGKRFLLRDVRKDDTHPFAKNVEEQLYFAADWPDFAGDPHWKKKLTPVRGNLSPRGFRTLAGFDHQAGVWFQVCQDRLGNWIPRGGRDIARFHSKDLVTWAGPELVLPVAPDESRAVKDYIEYMDLDAWRVGGPRTGAWLGALVIFHSDRSDPQYEMPRARGVWRKGTTEVRLVLSRDAGKSWQRVGGKEVWLPCHDRDNGYDRLVFAAKPVRVGDELWFYYSAWDGDHLTFRRDGTTWYKDRMRVARTARATLRLDGYVSLDAGPDASSLLTRPLRCGGESLVLNLSAPRGRLRAEVLDEAGSPVRGLGLADCEPLTGEGVALPIRWRSGASLKTLAGKVVRLRFELKDAALYSFRLV
jgi:hypothetical protein